MLHVVDRVLIGSDETADRGKGLGESAHDKFHVGEFGEMVTGAPSFVTKDAEAMGFINHEGCLVLVADVHELWDRSHIAFHGEYAVGDDEFGSFDGALLEDTLEVLDVVVLVFVGCGESDLFAFHDGGVVTFVVDDEIVAASDTGDYARIGLETSGEEHDAVLAHELGEFVLELDVDIEGAVEERRTRTTGAVFVDSGFSSLFDFWVVGEAEIGVGAEHKHLAAIDDHLGILLRRDGSEIGIDALGFGLLRDGILGKFFLQRFHIEQLINCKVTKKNS